MAPPARDFALLARYEWVCVLRYEKECVLELFIVLCMLAFVRVCFRKLSLFGKGVCVFLIN